MDKKEMKKWANWIMVFFAITTAFNLGNDILSHGNQMYILSALVLLHVFYFKS